MTKQVGNLPAEMSSFVDRRHEQIEIKRLLSTSRLVTVTGAGGVGKTRTTLRVAAEVTGDGKLAEEGKEQVKKAAKEPGAKPLGNLDKLT